MNVYPVGHGAVCGNTTMVGMCNDFPCEVDCTTAGDCKAFNRYECETVEGTCGACFEVQPRVIASTQL